MSPYPGRQLVCLYFEIQRAYYCCFVLDQQPILILFSKLGDDEPDPPTESLHDVQEWRRNLRMAQAASAAATAATAAPTPATAATHVSSVVEVQPGPTISPDEVALIAGMTYVPPRTPRGLSPEEFPARTPRGMSAGADQMPARTPRIQLSPDDIPTRTPRGLSPVGGDGRPQRSPRGMAPPVLVTAADNVPARTPRGLSAAATDAAYAAAPPLSARSHSTHASHRVRHHHHPHYEQQQQQQHGHMFGSAGSERSERSEMGSSMGYATGPSVRLAAGEYYSLQSPYGHEGKFVEMQQLGSTAHDASNAGDGATSSGSESPNSYTGGGGGGSRHGDASFIAAGGPLRSNRHGVYMPSSGGGASSGGHVSAVAKTESMLARLFAKRWVLACLLLVNVIALVFGIAALFLSLRIAGFTTQGGSSSIMNVLQVQSDGRLGVNTVSPQATLDVRF